MPLLHRPRAETRDARLMLPASSSTGGDEAQPAVLVVDDEPIIREVVSMLLEGEGYTGRRVADGVEALRNADADDIDLVLANVTMSRLAGVTLARRLGTGEQAVPVVLISVVSTGESPEVPFLRKPFAPDQVIQMVAARC